MKQPRILVLISARKDSKFLAKFLFGYLQNTQDQLNTKAHVMLNAHDVWNAELVEYFERETTIKFHYEDRGLGRFGLHEYFNQMLTAAEPYDWVIYFCEDHFIFYENWDSYFRAEIERQQLSPERVFCVVPKFDNVGAMNQMLSRAYVETLEGVLGRNGWIDSYINDLNNVLPSSRVIRLDEETFHDFTHDEPNMLDDSYTKTPLSEAGEELKKHKYDGGHVQSMIEDDRKKLTNAIIHDFK